MDIVNPPPARVTVHKLNTAGASVVTYPAMLVKRLPDGVRLEAEWTRPPLALGYTTFATGDRFVEWFYTDRWYNIFEVRAADGRLKGWYCNIAEPAVIAEANITCRDLLLDVWVTPHGASLLLDEDEFEADDQLDATTRARARQAVTDVLALVAARHPPFDAIVRMKIPHAE
ncbi:MAG TPA: DUF402 domain-containing protein [Ktedonobacterales bacterium]|nr:DUF402 domain-containing protein [Ktedonobacterales bacterium]